VVSAQIKQVQAKMAERNLDALVLLNAHNVVYTTGYFHLPTEQLLAVLIPEGRARAGSCPSRV
jgi:Xaa-Pro aminopeptidase